MSYALLSRKSAATKVGEAKALAKAPSSGQRIGEPNDSFEQEADRVAEEVMSGGRMKPSWSLSRMSIDAPLQRKCDCGGSSECEECKKDATIQRKSSDQIDLTQTAPEVVNRALLSHGQPLDITTRALMESRFRCDFGHVRIHNGVESALAARSVNALAYTVGSDVVFGEGLYSPQTAGGRRLLAHELAHTLQQGRVSIPPAPLSVSSRHGKVEREADRSADQVLADTPHKTTVPSTSGPVVQRQPGGAGGKSCSVEVCFIPIKRFGLGIAGFKHAVINVVTGGSVEHVEVDPDFHRPKGMLHSHVVIGSGQKSGDNCQTLPTTCAEASKVIAAANRYESKDVIYDPATQTGPNSNSFAEWTLAEAGINTGAVNTPFGASGWDYFTSNPAERTDPPHVLRSKPTSAPASTKTTGGAACTKVFQSAKSAADFVALVRQAESRMTTAGIVGTPDRIKILRGLYYGTPWSVDFADQQSASRIVGFELFTGTGTKYPRDPLSLFDCGLYQALQLSQDVAAKGGTVDIGHVMIALDARNAAVAGISMPNLPMPSFGGSGVEIVTWLGDLGGGAASLAIDRARSPKSPNPVASKFTGTDYGAASNLEGDIAGFVVARSSAAGHGGADVPSIPAGKGIADALEDYFVTIPKTSTAAWNQRARTFLTIYGGTFNAAGDLTNAARVSSDFADKIESFACNYLAQRKADSSASISDAEFLGAADNIRPCAQEVAETFVNTLADASKTPGLGLKATRFASIRPASPGACVAMTAILRLKLKLQMGRQWL